MDDALAGRAVGSALALVVSLPEQDADVAALLIGSDDVRPVAMCRTYGLVVNVRSFELRLSPRFRGR